MRTFKELMLIALSQGCKYFTCNEFEGRALITDAINLPYAWLQELATMKITGKQVKVARIKTFYRMRDISTYYDVA